MKTDLERGADARHQGVKRWETKSKQDLIDENDVINSFRLYLVLFAKISHEDVFLVNCIFTLGAHH